MTDRWAVVGLVPPSAFSFPVTRPADAPSSITDAGVLRCERVTIGAVGLSRVNSGDALGLSIHSALRLHVGVVVSERAEPEVRRVHAGRDVTGMADHEMIGDRPHEVLVAEAVRVDPPSTAAAETQSAVALLVDSPGPYPAAVLTVWPVDPFKESGEGGDTGRGDG